MERAEEIVLEKYQNFKSNNKWHGRQVEWKTNFNLEILGKIQRKINVIDPDLSPRL